MNDLKMSVALRICRAYTKKKLSLLKIENNVSDSLLMSMSQVDEHVLMHMLSICRRIFARLAIHDICMTCDCAVFSMLRSSCAYARLQYFALAVYHLATLAI